MPATAPTVMTAPMAPVLQPRLWCTPRKRTHAGLHVGHQEIHRVEGNSVTRRFHRRWMNCSPRLDCSLMGGEYGQADDTLPSCHRVANDASECSIRRAQEIDVGNREAWSRRGHPASTHCPERSQNMAGCLEGFTIAVLAADGVCQVVLETSGEVVRQAGARTQLLSLQGRAHRIARQPIATRAARTASSRRWPKRKPTNTTPLLLLPGSIKAQPAFQRTTSCSRSCVTSSRRESRSRVVCHGAWTLLEAGVARSRALPSHLTMRALRQTGASILDGEPISPYILRAFYHTIVDEFARLNRAGHCRTDPENEHRWTRPMVSPTL